MTSPRPWARALFGAAATGATVGRAAKTWAVAAGGPVLWPLAARSGRAVLGWCRRDRAGVLAAAWLAGLLVCAAVPGLVAAADPFGQDVTLTRLLEGPGWDHRLGTDRYGRDLFSRVVWGARPAVVSIAIGVGLSAGTGVPVGLAAGWWGAGPTGLSCGWSTSCSPCRSCWWRWRP